MARARLRCPCSAAIIVGLIAAPWIATRLAATDPPRATAAKTDLPGFKSPQAAEATPLEALATVNTAPTGYLGLRTEAAAQGKLLVKIIAPDSPAQKAGVQVD